MSEAINKVPEFAGRPAGWDKTNPISDFVRDTLALAEVELRKLRRDPAELLTRAIQPALWLLIFGQVFARLRAIPTGRLDYMTFMAPGILAQSVLFVAIFYGISAIWERDLGVLQRYLVSPAPRSALVIGKALSASVRALSQALIVYVLTLTLGVDIDLQPGSIFGAVAAIAVGSALFST